MSSEALIYTTLGNVPIDSLSHSVEWKVTPEQIIFTESYSKDGEIVKQSAHIHILTGAEAIGEASI